MNLFRQHYRAWLVPYVEGTLDARRRARLEARLAHDSALAAEAEAQRRVVLQLRQAAHSSADEAAPAGASLWPRVEARLRPPASPARPWVWAVGGLCVAASLIWVMFWGPLGHPGGPGLQPVPIAQGGTPVNTMPTGLSRDRGRRRVHRLHRFGDRLAVRPASPASPVRSHESHPDATPATDLQAANDMPPTDGAPGTATPPKTSSGARFQLAAHEDQVDDSATKAAISPGPSADVQAAPGDKPTGTPVSPRRRRHRHRALPGKVPDTAQAPSAGSVEDGSPNSPSGESAPKPPAIHHTPLD